MTQVKLFTVDEYFALERASDVKHEYIDGEIRDVPGAKRNHGRIAQQLSRLLGNLLAGSDCFIYIADMRVQVDPEKYTYPDLVMVCGEEQYRDEASVDTLLNPTIVIEIISDSTAHYDYGRKLSLYQSVPSIRQIVLVEQDEPFITWVMRTPDASWSHHTASGLDELLTLTAIGLTLPLREVYATVPFD
jgi:Uma2 family endonuclease